MVRLAIAIPLAVGLHPLSATADGTGSITGRVIDQDTGGPAAGVVVQACVAPGCGATATTDASGDYTLSNISAWPWAVVTNGTADCAGQTYARAELAVVNVSVGQTTQAPDLRVSREKGSIAGHVYDAESGTPIAGVLVTANNSEQGGAAFNQSRSDASGYYRIDCLPPGRGYFLQSSPPSPYAEQSDSQYDVQAGAVTTHDVTLHRGDSSITAGLTCGGSPCAGEEVFAVEQCGGSGTANSNGCATWSGRSGSDGSFTATGLPAGTYIVHVFSSPGWDEEAWFGVKVAGGTQVRLGSLPLQPATSASSGRIMGHVAFANGTPDADCKLNAFSQLPNPALDNGQGFASGVPVDAGGNYDTGWTMVPGGLYHVYLDCNGFPEIDQGTNPGGSSLTISAGHTLTVNFRLTGNRAGAAPPAVIGSQAAASAARRDPARPWWQILLALGGGILVGLALVVGGALAARRRLIRAGSR